MMIDRAFVLLRSFFDGTLRSFESLLLRLYCDEWLYRFGLYQTGLIRLTGLDWLNCIRLDQIRLDWRWLIDSTSSRVSNWWFVYGFGQIRLVSSAVNKQLIKSRAETVGAAPAGNSEASRASGVAASRWKPVEAGGSRWKQLSLMISSELRMWIWIGNWIGCAFIS